MDGPRFRKNIEDFICMHCGSKVKGSGYTDHCPKCLWSRHVDVMPGDRQSECRAAMMPIGTEYDRKGYVIFYRCAKCGMEKRMKAAEEDDADLLISMASSEALYFS